MSGKVLKLLSEGKTDTAKIKMFRTTRLDGKVIKLDDMIKMNLRQHSRLCRNILEQESKIL